MQSLYFLMSMLLFIFPPFKKPEGEKIHFNNFIIFIIVKIFEAKIFF